MANTFNLIEQIVASLEDALILTEELAASGSDQSFPSKLRSLPSNTIGQQFWCIAGARESYAAAILQGEWTGFHPKLAYDDAHLKEPVLAALIAGREAISRSVQSLSADQGWSSERFKFLTDCLMHEAQHQGQLIRYWYALALPFPPAFASRWALDEADSDE